MADPHGSLLVDHTGTHQIRRPTKVHRATRPTSTAPSPAGTPSPLEDRLRALLAA